MVEDEIRDPDRIAALLRDEIEGLADPPFDSLLVDSAPETTPEGTVFVVTDGEETLCSVMKQVDRLVLEFRRHPDVVAETADATGLESRPKATTPPSTVVFVERAADLKRVIDVFRATHDSQ